MAYVINEDCIACGSCISECPVEAISEGDIYVIDPDICTDCVLVQMFVLQKLTSGVIKCAKINLSVSTDKFSI